MSALINKKISRGKSRWVEQNDGKKANASSTCVIKHTQRWLPNRYDHICICICISMSMSICSHICICICMFISLCAHLRNCHQCAVNCSKALDLFAIKFYWFINAAHHSTVAIKLPTIFSDWEHTRGNREGVVWVLVQPATHTLIFENVSIKINIKYILRFMALLRRIGVFCRCQSKDCQLGCREFVPIISNLYDIFIARNCFAF